MSVGRRFLSFLFFSYFFFSSYTLKFIDWFSNLLLQRHEERGELKRYNHCLLLVELPGFVQYFIGSEGLKDENTD